MPCTCSVACSALNRYGTWACTSGKPILQYGSGNKPSCSATACIMLCLCLCVYNMPLLYVFCGCIVVCRCHLQMLCWLLALLLV